MNMQHLKDSLRDLYTGVLKPAAIKTGEVVVAGLDKAAEKTKEGVVWTKKNLVTAHTRDKALEVVERSVESFFLMGQILIEAVFGLRQKNQKYPSPWEGFTWSGPAELVIFQHYEEPKPDKVVHTDDCDGTCGGDLICLDSDGMYNNGSEPKQGKDEPHV